MNHSTTGSHICDIKNTVIPIQRGLYEWRVGRCRAGGQEMHVYFSGGKRECVRVCLSMRDCHWFKLERYTNSSSTQSQVEFYK